MSLNLSFIQHVQPPQGSEGERTRVQRDDILVCITGALTGNVAHANMDLPATAFVNQHVALVRPNQAIVYPRYLAFALHSEIGRIQFKAGEYGGTKQGLGLDDVKSALVLLPPMSEQIAICSELDTKIAGLAMVVSRTEHESSLLREYRTRMIADIVTGKLDVRGVELPEVDEAEALEDWNTDVDVEAEEIADVEEAVDADE
jgi:type I restriction enzyme S subunit